MEGATQVEGPLRAKGRLPGLERDKSLLGRAWSDVGETVGQLVFAWREVMHVACRGWCGRVL